MLDQQTVMILLAVGFTAIVMYMAAKNGKLPGVGKVSSKSTKKVGGDPFKPEAYAAQPMVMATASRDALTRAEAAQLEDRILQRVQEVVASTPVSRSAPDLPPRQHLDVLHDMVLGAVEEKKATDAKMAAVKSGLASLGQ